MNCEKKVLFLLILILAGSVSCGSNAGEGSGERISSRGQADGNAKIEFRTVRYDFGKVKPGEKLSYTFIYKNTGNAPLIINSARADCGCTVPEYTGEPVEPGSEGQIKVVFDTQGFMGYQTKTIRLATNAVNPVVTLALRAIIE